MTKLFGVDIAAEVYKATKGELKSATLHVITPGTRSAADRTAGTQPTTVNHTCEGVVDLYHESMIGSGRVEMGDRKVILIAKSLPSTVIPKAGDTITIEGQTWDCIWVERDPATATYGIQVRGGK
jgi:hypothetical protein